MITCKKAGPLLDKKEFEKLPFLKRIGLRIHLSWCRLCKGYKKDSPVVSELVRMVRAEDGRELSVAEKERIKTALAEHEK